MNCPSLMKKHCRDVKNNYLIKKSLKINLLALRLMRSLLKNPMVNKRRKKKMPKKQTEITPTSRS